MMYQYSGVRKNLMATLVVGICALLGTSAWAEEGFDLQQFSPMPDQSRNFLSASSAMVSPHLEWQGFLLLNHGNAPLVVRNSDGERASVVGSHSMMNLMGSVGLYDIVELGLDLPLFIQQSSGDVSIEGLDLDGAGVGLGDIRLVPKVQVFSTREAEAQEGMAVAVISDLYLPLGDGSRLQGGEFRGAVRLACDVVINNGTRFAVNAGYLMRPTREVAGLEVGDALTWAVAGEIPITAVPAPSDLRIVGEFAGKVGVGVEEITVAQMPVELLVGARYQYDNIFAQLGGGVGLASGYGTPRMRAIFSMGFVASTWHSPEAGSKIPASQVSEPSSVAEEQDSSESQKEESANQDHSEDEQYDGSDEERVED